MPHDNLNFANPRNVFVVAGDRWQDDEVVEIDYTEEAGGDDFLNPGEELTAVEAVATDRDVMVAIRAAATTSHAADLDGDNQSESIIRYRYEVKPDTPRDRYHELPGMSSTLPLGRMGNPEELVPGTYIGPVSSFRIVFENRSDEFPNPTDVDIGTIGAHVHGRVLRGVDPTSAGNAVGHGNGGGR